MRRLRLPEVSAIMRGVVSREADRAAPMVLASASNVVLGAA